MLHTACHIGTSILGGVAENGLIHTAEIVCSCIYPVTQVAYRRIFSACRWPPCFCYDDDAERTVGKAQAAAGNTTFVIVSRMRWLVPKALQLSCHL